MEPKPKLLLEILEKSDSPLDIDELVRKTQYAAKGITTTLYDLQKQYGVVGAMSGISRFGIS